MRNTQWDRKKYNMKVLSLEHQKVENKVIYKKYTCIHHIKSSHEITIRKSICGLNAVSKHLG